MKAIESIAEELFEKLKSRFENINLGDEKADETVEPDQARFFNFDYTQGKENFGTVTISLGDKKGLKIFYSKNITENDELDKPRWYKFLRGLRRFARRNMMTFDARDINKKSLDIRDLKTFAKTHKSDVDMDDLNESVMYGTKMSSYQKVRESVRIIVKHRNKVDETVHGARSRNIEKIYIENGLGERFLVPSASLLEARVIARHVANGGSHTDSYSKHVGQMVQEMKDLRYFAMTSKRRQFEDATTKEMVEAAISYYNTIKETLHKLKGQRGYANYMNTFEDTLAQEQVEINEELRDRFIKRMFDQRLEAAMPLVAKAYAQRVNEATRLLKKVDEFIQSGKRFGLNEGDREYLSLIEFTDKNAFMVKMLEQVSIKLSEHDEQLSQFARNMMENWGTASSGNKDMASRLVRNFIKEMRDVVREDNDTMPTDESRAAEFMELLSQPLPAGPDGAASTAIEKAFKDDKLDRAIRDIAAKPGGTERDIRPLVVVRFLEVAGDPQGREFELGEMQYIADVLEQLKTNDIGRKYAEKIDTILQKYPAQEDTEEEPEQPEQEPQAPAEPAPEPAAPAPAPAQPAAPAPAPMAPVQQPAV